MLQVKGVVETVGFQHVADAAIEPFHHPIGLGRLRQRQAVLDAQFGADLVKLLGPMADNGSIVQRQHHCAAPAVARAIRPTIR